MMKRCGYVILLACVLLGVEGTVYASTISPITPLSEDYWKPTEYMEYEIIFSDVCETPCYVEGVKVNRLEISDVQTDEKFLENEMKLGHFSDAAYETRLQLNEQVLFQGAMDALVKDEVYFEKPIYLKEETSITLRFDVSFAAQSGNSYQNKQYVYEFLPFGYRVIEDEQTNPPVTGLSGGLVVVGFGLIALGVRKRGWRCHEKK